MVTQTSTTTHYYVIQCNDESRRLHRYRTKIRGATLYDAHCSELVLIDAVRITVIDTEKMHFYRQMFLYFGFQVH